MMCKPFWLFNVGQIDRLPVGLPAPAAETMEFSPIEEAERILRDSGAEIRHGFDAAFYSPSKDQICLPVRERFTSPESYYATALHELAHWTGHASRLDRGRVTVRRRRRLSRMAPRCWRTDRRC